LLSHPGIFSIWLCSVLVVVGLYFSCHSLMMGSVLSWRLERH